MARCEGHSGMDWTPHVVMMYGCFKKKKEVAPCNRPLLGCLRWELFSLIYRCYFTYMYKLFFLIFPYRFCFFFFGRFEVSTDGNYITLKILFDAPLYCWYIYIFLRVCVMTLCTC